MNTIKLCPIIKAAIALGVQSQDGHSITNCYNIVIKFLGFDGIDTTAYKAKNLLEMKTAMISIARNWSVVAP